MTTMPMKPKTMPKPGKPKGGKCKPHTVCQLQFLP
jgi:hypothetical protein